VRELTEGQYSDRNMTQGHGEVMPDPDTVIGLTKTAALEYGQQGVRINAICPGTARTPMVERVVAETPELEEELVRLHPIGRIAEPVEIAEAALWLCSPRSSFVAGSPLIVDGGYVAQ